MRAYLAGGMERAPDRGRAWRASLAPFLEALGHDVYNPCDEELLVVSEEERSQFRAWKEAGDERFAGVMRRIIAHDVAALRDSDYVVCLWDEHAQGSGGTPSELTLAHVWGKPVYVVRAMSRGEMSSWVQGCATAILDSLDELMEFLRREHA